MIMRCCIKKIAAAFSEEKIEWALGGSMILFYKGLTVQPNDIDLIVSIRDIEKADRILSEAVGKVEQKNNDENSSLFSTKYFFSYAKDNIHIDLMAGLKINYDLGSYEYSLSKNLDYHIIDNVEIPLCPLEDWYILYIIMNRDIKVQLLESYFHRCGINTKVIKLRIEEDLPMFIVSKLKSFLL